MPAKAVILLSGGMDSATCLAIARRDGFDCYGLSFDYGQRHGVELDAARSVAAAAGCAAHRVLKIELGELGGSALTDQTIEVPEVPGEGIPVTYVPARNTVFLAFALAWAEVLDAERIYVGVNAIDYSGYPDCRPEYIEAFQHMANLATKRGVEGKELRILTPLIDLRKHEIIRLGNELGVDYAVTVSCYQADERGRACGRCDACRLRRAGFDEAGCGDPTRYRSG
jgi:7-cyano-7-deazaguanine synthase